MAEVTRVRTNKRLYNLSYNPAEYFRTPFGDPLQPFRQQIILVDDTEPVLLDSERLSYVFMALNAKDYAVYFHLLTKLRYNNVPVEVDIQEIRSKYKIKWQAQIGKTLQRLCREGLIHHISDARGLYLINPVYAWKGNRIEYLKPEIFREPEK